ncbi:MAG TPA: hypothetical protein VK130_03835, partial [Steroidobacteraceae bacterium]|nr:hypothetical protein [Steroidobacteraceae bacterium]
MRRSVSWCAQSRDSKATFNNNLMQTWHYTFGPHAPQTQVLCGFLNRPTAATVEDGLDDVRVDSWLGHLIGVLGDNHRCSLVAEAVLQAFEIILPVVVVLVRSWRSAFPSEYNSR